MRKVTLFWMVAAVFTTMTVGTGSVHAELLARSPSLTAPGGFPAWYQGQDGLALSPCLDQTTPGNPCGLLSEPGFNAAQPIAFPNNFPSEVFYYTAQSDTILVGAAGVTADVLMAIEGGFADPVTGVLVLPAAPGAVPIVFNRMRVRISPAQGTVLAAGTYSVAHPFSTTPITFPCNENGNNSACTFTIDLPAANIFDFNGALAIGIPNTMTVFLRQTAPLPATGFIGDSASIGPITGGPVRNSFDVSGPPGSGSTTNFTVTGKSLGIEVTPQAGANFGVWKITAPSTPSTPVTLTVTNRTGVNIPARNTTVNPPLGLILTPSSPVFTIPAATDTCAAGITAVAPGDTCTFNVVFTPTTEVVSTGTVSVASTVAPTITVPVTGTGDSIAPTLTLDPVITFTNLATQTISGTVTDINGVASVDVTVAGVSQGIVNITPGTPSTWSKLITLSNATPAGTANSISVTATDTAQTGGNTSIPSVFAGTITTITTDTINPEVSVTAPASGSLINTRTPALTFDVIEANPSITSVTVDTALLNPTPANNTALASLLDGLHTVKVDAIDSASNAGSATTTFTVDATPPAIAVTSPKPVNGRVGVTTPALTFSVTDANNVPANTVVKLDNVVVPAGTAALGPFLAGSAHILTVDATDLAGNVAPTTSVAFTVVLADGRVVSLGATPATIADAIKVLRHIVGISPLLTPDEFAHADVAPLDANGVPNPDGTVNITDALLILRRVVNLVTTF